MLLIELRIKQAFDMAVMILIYNVHVKVMSPDDFLTTITAKGPRMTLHSTLDLSKYSSGDLNIEFVLTGK